jgi:DNA polymerase/3'-5' exonuclease PolX
MSEGPRYPWKLVEAAAKSLRISWGLDTDALFVGSFRRGSPTCGDLEILAKHEPAESDPLFETIERTLGLGGLFGNHAPEIEGKALEGFKPGFLSCSLVVQMVSPPAPLPVQIFRATPEGWGWAVLMRTGPRDFGVEFLRRWKIAWEIPEGSKASDAGLLRDRWGKIVPVLSEREAFEKCRMPWVEPNERDAVALALRSRR